MKKLLILVVCCLCLCGCGNDFEGYNYNSGTSITTSSITTSKSTTQKTNITVENNDYDFDISLKEMSEIYYNNELDGNKKFFGKKVKTKAKFNQVSTGTFSGLIAYFDELDSIYGIYCVSFDKKTKNKLNTFNRNEVLTVIGTVDTLSSSSIKFKNCNINKSS